MKRYAISGYDTDYVEIVKGEWVRFTDAEAAIKTAVEAERKNCAELCRGLRDDWMQEHGAETAYNSGRVTALYNAENAIRARGE